MNTNGPNQYDRILALIHPEEPQPFITVPVRRNDATPDQVAEQLLRHIEIIEQNRKGKTT